MRSYISRSSFTRGLSLGNDASNKNPMEWSYIHTGQPFDNDGLTRKPTWCPKARLPMQNWATFVLVTPQQQAFQRWESRIPVKTVDAVGPANPTLSKAGRRRVQWVRITTEEHSGSLNNTLGNLFKVLIKYRHVLAYLHRAVGDLHPQCGGRETWTLS